MKNKITLSFCCLWIISFSLYSQGGEGPDFENFNRYSQTNFSTPEVKAFEKVALIPNNLSTGKLGLTIPIYTIKTGRLTYPIKISYNSGGIKVDQQASEIGLGWNLSKTIISRQIIDGNDFDNVGTQWRDPVGGGFGGDLNDPEFEAHWTVYNYHNKGRMGYFLKTAENRKASATYKTIDEMPDIYSLASSDGFSTKFYFRDKETPIELTEGNSIINTDEVKQTFANPLYNLDSNYTIYFPMYDFGKIEVTSKDGIKYTFEDYDVSITTSYEKTAGFNNGYDAIGAGVAPMVSAWHISKIEDLLTGDIIEFEYQTYNADPVNAPLTVSNPTLPDALLLNESIKTIPKRPWLASFNDCPPGYNRWSFDYNNHKYSYERFNHTRYYVKNRLVNIKFNGGQIDFNWGSDRLDLYNTKKLNNISIYSKEDGVSVPNKLINRFDFSFDYFDSGCSNSYKCKRLKLESVKELGKPSYEFNYFSQDGYFPEITSNKKDFLGYYNSSVTQTQDSHILPNLYYYPNEKEYSILPFNISGVTNYPIYGDYDDVPSLSDVKKWTLNSIRYPTGAVTNLEYELNEINIFDQNVPVTGLRLASSTITDENNIVRNIEYTYVKEDGSSSGTLVNPPNYGRPTIWINLFGSNSDLPQWETSAFYDTFEIDQYPKVDADLTNGNYISYSDIKEEEVGNGYTIYTFTSNETEPNEYYRSDPTQEPLNHFTGGDLCEAVFVKNNSAFGLDFYTDNSFKRGKLVSKKVFDSNSNLKREIINTYSENTDFESETFKKRFFRVNNQYSSGFNDDFENMFDVAKTYPQNTFKLIKSRTLNYFNGEVLEVIEDFQYNSLGLLATSIKQINPNENYISNYTYVVDSNISETGISQLQTINYLSDLVQQDAIYSFQGSNENINSSKKEYNTNGFVDKVYTKNKGNSFIEEFEFDLYNSRGKPNQFRDKSGKITSMFWSNDLLIARVENATYNSIKNYIQSNNGYNIENCEAGNCAQYFSENLRAAFPDAQVYSYAYDSTLEGVISVTDPNNETFYYEYDNYGRLLHIKDKNNNILSKNDYNYRLPN